MNGDLEVRGEINVSGLDGGQVNTAGAEPVAGAGGTPGPGGGAGGAGGIATSSDVTHPEAGGYPPPLPDANRADVPDFGEFDPPPTSGPGEPFVVFPATAGESVNSSCGSGCVPGHGGGGGYSSSGGNGATGANGSSGVGGLFFGNKFLQNPDNGDPLPVGGTGGAGGGGRFASPGGAMGGSGGGGAGGYVQISVNGPAIFGSTARIVADGGRAFQAPAGGGNGGGGAGGAVLIEGDGLMVFETGTANSSPRISVLGGAANVPPTADFDGVPGVDYAGNGLANAGGSGAPGRILIRSPIGFNEQPATTASPPYIEYPTGAGAPATGVFPNAIVGAFTLGVTQETVAATLPYRVTQELGIVSSNSTFSLPVVRYLPALQPAGTSARVRVEGASESLETPGGPGNFQGLVEDPSVLNGSEYLRLTIFLYSTAFGSVVPTIDQVDIPVGFSVSP